MGKAISTIMPTGGDGPKGPPPTPTIKQTPDLTNEQLMNKRKAMLGTGGQSLPMFMGLSNAMTPLQQRTAIATNATSGSGQGVDSEALGYYRQLAMNSLINDKGQFSPYSDITPVELQYLQRAGVQPRNSTTQSFLSALDRAISGDTSQ